MEAKYQVLKMHYYYRCRLSCLPRKTADRRLYGPHSRSERRSRAFQEVRSSCQKRIRTCPKGTWRKTQQN